MVGRLVTDMRALDPVLHCWLTCDHRQVTHALGLVPSFPCRSVRPGGKCQEKVFRRRAFYRRIFLKEKLPVTALRGPSMCLG